MILSLRLTSTGMLVDRVLLSLSSPEFACTPALSLTCLQKCMNLYLIRMLKAKGFIFLNLEELLVLKQNSGAALQN